MLTPNDQNSNQTSNVAQESYWVERTALFASIFFLAFGLGLMTDGKKLYQNQLKLSQRIDYRATLNPYQD